MGFTPYTQTAQNSPFDTTGSDFQPVAITPLAGNQLKVSDSGHVHPVGYAEASFTVLDTSFIAWSFDPALSANSSAPTTGQVNIIRVNLRQSASITNVSVGVGTGGTSLTSGQNLMCLFNSSGTLLGTTADQTTPFASTGLKTAALTGGPFVLGAGFCWVGVVSNTTGTTPSLLRCASQPAPTVNVGFAAATARFATNGTATTAFATITPSSNVLAGVAYWAAVS